MLSINFTFNPKELEASLGGELDVIKDLLYSKFSKLEGLNFYEIQQVDLLFEKNRHEGNNTINCKLMVESLNKHQKSFVKNLEGHNVLGIITELANEAVEFVFSQQEKNSN